MAQVRNGGGIAGWLRRVWYYLTINIIGLKWMVREFFGKHRKLDIQKLPKRYGEVAVVTGGARGIGLEVVKMLAQAGIHVVIGCRSVGAGRRSVTELAVPGASFDVLELDLMSLASVRSFAASVLLCYPDIHILVNNAGIMFPPYQVTMDGFESQFQVNYLSHFLLTNLLLPGLVSGGNQERSARVVNVSSCASYGGKINFKDLQMENMYSREMAYMASKLLQVISSTDLNTRLSRHEVQVKAYSVHPGVVQTDLYQHLWWASAFNRLLKFTMKSPLQGAEGVAYAAMSPDLEGKGGLFLANCQPYLPNPKVFDEALQQKVWDVSSELATVEFILFMPSGVSGMPDAEGTYPVNLK